MSQLKKSKKSKKKSPKMMNEILSESQLMKEMGVKNYPMKKLEEIPILPKGQSLILQSPMSMKLKSLQKSMRDLATNLMLEPTKEQSHLWLNKKMQNEWRLKQNQNQALNQSRSAMIAYLSSKP